MEVKRDILWRVYLSYILMVIACIAIFGKAVYIQQVEGAKWRSMSDSLHQRIDEIEAERGTIYSEDGQMLSTSIPQFDIFIDFRVAGLREKNGLRFRENIDSLSFHLAQLFKDMSPVEYKRVLQQAYKAQDGYFPLKKKISFTQYDSLRNFPLFKLGRYKSGMIANERTIRLNPYQMLAFRTIGLARDSNKVGLEKTYDAVLKGRNGKQTVRSIAGGIGVPVDDTYLIEPETGKAIVNLGRMANGTYWENLNYAITPSEPGSTFKLATLMALLEDKKVNLNQTLNLENGVWRVAGQTVYDSERHAENIVTVKQAFELSSNVAMAKMAVSHYSNNPQQYLKHLRKMRMDTITGIDLVGERKPVIHRPGSKLYGPTTIPWMSFGYNLAISPLHTAMLYNAIANNGTMMRPYLVSSIKEEGVLLKEIPPVILDTQICSPATLAMLKASLEGVCIAGTAKSLFAGTPYKVAGKTGTALVADGNRGYANKIYQSSFAGYFPADNPQYTCVVVIKNKPFAANFYGASVAGPVFKEIADRLYGTYIKTNKTLIAGTNKKDSTYFKYNGYKADLAYLSEKLQLKISDSTGRADEWTSLNKNTAAAVMQKMPINKNAMPPLKGLGLKDALYLCEEMGLMVQVKGRGRVLDQSILPGQPIAKGQLIQINLN